MGLLLDLVTLPVLGGPKLVHRLACSLADRAMDEGPIRAELVEIQERYDAGEMEEEEYDRKEKGLLERLDFIRELKKACEEGK